MRALEKGFVLVLVLVLVLVAAAIGVFVFLKPAGKQTIQISQNFGSKKSSTEWSSPVKVINGYADADVVDLGNGQYRMYVGDVPGQSSFSHAIYSAISSDGKSFKLENGIRQTNASFPDVVKLPDGTYRMYYQGTAGIRSSVSTDGLSWKGESGVRIDSTNNFGLTLTEVGASTTAQMKDGSYVMVYRATMIQTYDSDAPNKGTNLLVWATSKDGLNFEKKGIAVDSRNSLYDGWLDGPDFSVWGNEVRLYYWTYSGIYYATFDGTNFSGDNLAIAAKSDNPMAKFSPNPPGDPSVIKIGNTWYLYYGTYDGEKNLQTIYYVTQ